MSTANRDRTSMGGINMSLSNKLPATRTEQRPVSRSLLKTADASMHLRRADDHSPFDNEYPQNMFTMTHASQTYYQPKALDYGADITNFTHTEGLSKCSNLLDLGQYSPLSKGITKDNTEAISLNYLKQVLSNGNASGPTQSIRNRHELFGSSLSLTCLDNPRSSPLCAQEGKLPQSATSLLSALNRKKDATNGTNSCQGDAGNCRHSRQSPQRLSAVFSITNSVVLLLALLQPPIAMATNLSSREFHPSQVLSSSSPMPSDEASASSRNRISPAAARAEDEVKEDEVLHHLYRNGRNMADFRKPSVTFMVELFNDLQRGGTLGYSNRVEPVTDTVRSFSGKNSRRSRKGKRTVDFHVPYLPQHETLRAAEIRFLRSPTQKKAFRRFRFRIDIRARGKTINKFTFRENAKAQYEYNVFDVTNIVRPWINNHHGNMSLHIRVSRKLKNHLLMPSKDNPTQSTSLIVLYLEDKEFLKNMYASFTKSDEKTTNPKSSPTLSISSSNSSPSSKSSKPRTKRSAAVPPPASVVQFSQSPGDNVTEEVRLSRTPRSARFRRPRTRKTKSRRYRPARRENCKMYDFYVDFTVIGWGEWIIHPKRFNSKFCFGQCPSPIEAKYHPTNHAMLQTLMRMKLPNVAPSPCCVPTKLKAVSMLYVEYDEIVVRSHEDMVVDQCGCR